MKFSAVRPDGNVRLVEKAGWSQMARRAGGEVIALDTARENQSSVSPSMEAAEGPSFREYIGILSKRRWVVIGFFVAVVTTAGIWVWREPRIYRAFATLEINPNAPRILGQGVADVSESGTGAAIQSKDFYETQFQIMASRTVAQRVVDKLGLSNDPQFLGVSKIKDPAEQKEVMKKIDAASVLANEIHIDQVRESRIAKVSVEDTSPERAMRIANTLAEAYIEYNMERKADTTRDATIWLEEQLGGLKTKMETSELDLHEFKKSHDILSASFEDKQSISSQRMLALSDALTRVRTRRAELDSRLKSLADAQKRLAAGDREFIEAIPSVAQSAQVDSLNLSRVQLMQDKAVIEQRFAENHPRHTEVALRLSQLDAELKREINKFVLEAKTEWNEAINTQKELEGLIIGAKREAFAVNEYEIDYMRYKREAENNERLYDLVLQRLKDADLSGRLRSNNVQMLDTALIPGSPVKPQKMTIMVIAAIVGLLGGIGAALTFEQLDNTIKTHDDVERYLHAAFLGIMPSIREVGQDQLSPAERGRNRDLHSHRRPKSSVAECVRAVRTNLLFMMPDKPLKRLLITSSGPQEGKTTFVTNLAITMAQSGSRTLLVDTDMRRPRIHRAFGLPNDAGMSNLMLQQARLEDLVKDTAVPNLQILPCGPIPPNPSELLHTERFKEILEELDSKYDRIIFDSPPVAAVTDALIISGMVDGVVLVVKAGRTIGEMAQRTKQSLDDVNARIFGVVINDLDLEKRGYGYYYYYQRYGYYYGEKQSEA
jgi:capsular exopolysaccharide synthesis family protein